MSLDYYVWAGPKLSADEFAARLERMDEVGPDALETTFQASRRLGWFRQEVLAKYPALEALPDDAPSPWSMTPPDSARLIALTFHVSATEEQVMFVYSRAMINGLYVYDAQAHQVYSPGPARWQIWLRRFGLGRLAGPDP